MADTAFSIQLLSDTSTLEGIYSFRVDCYENSSNYDIINSQIFPNGWKDDLDETSFHWVIYYQDKIIATARLSILKSHTDLEQAGFSLDDIYQPNYPVGLISRLVIAKEFRGKQLSGLLDEVRLNKLIELNMHCALAGARLERVNSLIKKGFEIKGEIIFSATPISKAEILTLLIWTTGYSKQLSQRG